MLVLTQHGPVHLKAILRGLTNSESWGLSVSERQTGSEITCIRPLSV